MTDSKHDSSLADAVRRFIHVQNGGRFTSKEAVEQLPQFNAQSIRASLQKLARIGHLCNEPGPSGKENIYWEPAVDETFGRRAGRLFMSQELIDAMGRFSASKRPAKNAD